MKKEPIRDQRVGERFQPFLTEDVLVNKMFKMCLVLASTTMLTTGVQAATGGGTSTATIVTPITITPVNNLAFGKLDAKTGGTVNMTVGGARSIASGTTVLMNTGNTSNQATFTIGGEANATYAITLPADGVVTLTGAGTAMPVDGFVSNPAATGTLSGAGAQTVNVGAVLTVGSGQTAGPYTGSFDVIVEYN